MMLFFSILICVNAVTWTSCPVQTNISPPEKNIFYYIKEIIPIRTPTLMNMEITLPPSAECALFDFPLNRNDPKELIGVFVKKYTRLNSSKIIFLLPSIPGRSSDSLEKIAFQLYDDLKDHDIYLVDHRGVGRSTRIGCVPSGGEEEGSDGGIEIVPSEIESCEKDMNARYGENIIGFSTTSASEDVIDILKVVNPNSKPVDILGIGYGTYWANRVVQVGQQYNMTFRSLILDSVYSQSGEHDHKNYTGKRLTWDYLNVNFGEVGSHFLDTCVQRFNECGERLMKDGFNITTSTSVFVMNVIKNVFNGNLCPRIRDVFGGDRNSMKEFLGSLLIDVYYRELIPPFLYRVLRCDEYDDFGVFEHIRQFIDEENDKVLFRIPLSSIMEGMHITYNEFYSYPFPSSPTDILKKRTNDSTFALLQDSFGDYLVNWHKYIENDEFFRKTTQVDGNMKVLMLSGEYDPITPPQYSITQKYNMGNGENIIQKTISFSTHNVINNSPMNDAKDKQNCGYKIVVNFLNNDLDVDFSCISNMKKISFNGDPRISELVFGCEEPWDCRFIERSKELMVSLELFIIAEVSTIVAFMSVISVIVYCCCVKLARNAAEKVKKNMKEEGYEMIDDDYSDEQEKMGEFVERGNLFYRSSSLDEIAITSDHVHEENNNHHHHHHSQSEHDEEVQHKEEVDEEENGDIEDDHVDVFNIEEEKLHLLQEK